MIKTNNVNFWSGVVIDINDPLKANRVKVRIFGLHDGKETDLPNSALHWALVSMPVTGSSMTGIGTNHNLKNGSVVVVTFLDGEEMQIPIVIGSVAGIQVDALPKLYQDPAGEYPLKDRMGEPDVNRIARNEKIDETIIQTKKDTVDTGIPNANGKGMWDEPQTDYNAVYPYNRVVETISGHVIEIDDTPGASRLHIYHKSGTSVEVQDDGKMITRVIGDDFEIDNNNKNLHVKGNCNVTIDGNSTVYVKGNADLQIGGDSNTHIQGNANLTIDKDFTTNVSGNVTETIGGNYTRSVSGSATMTSGGDTTIQGSTINLN